MEQVSFTKIVTGLPDIIDSLPNNDPDVFCRCGECDGYGHIFDDTGMRICSTVIAMYLNNTVDQAMFSNAEETKSVKVVNNFFSLISKSYSERTEIRKFSMAILCGGNGVGKTYAMNCLSMECLKSKIPVMKVEWIKLVDQKMNGVDGYKWFRAFESSLKNRFVLMVDEVGRSHENNRHEQEIGEYLIRLCFQKRFLVASTNLHPNQLGSIFGEGYCKSRIQPSWIYDVGFDKNLDLRKYPLATGENHGE